MDLALNSKPKESKPAFHLRPLFSEVSGLLTAMLRTELEQTGTKTGTKLA
jgi:hypothetical protein